MTDLARTYIHEVMELLRRVEDEEIHHIRDAARILADTIISGGRIFAFGCTHSSLPIQDLVYRAGGLALINPIFGPGISSLDVRPASMTSKLERIMGYAQIILDSAPVRAGDALILVSVSGRNEVPVEMAQIASQRGIRLIAVTSMEYSGQVQSRHPSGRKMHEYADVVLDNKVAKGDALLRVDGLAVAFCPASGVTGIAILQALVAATVERLLEVGFTPPVFMAGNVDGGPEYNSHLFQQHKDRIFYE